jgi:hypothetical protein
MKAAATASRIVDTGAVRSAMASSNALACPLTSEQASCPKSEEWPPPYRFAARPVPANGNERLRTGPFTPTGVGYQAGFSLGSGMTFGYLAARHIAGLN